VRPRSLESRPLGKRHSFGWIANLLAFALIAGLAAMPFLLQRQATPPWVHSAERTSPVPLTTPEAGLPAVALSSAAAPISPQSPPAHAPNVDSVRSAALVAGEDLRLRDLIHHVGRLVYPTVMPPMSSISAPAGTPRNNVSTLVLPGPASYTVADLQAAGAAEPLVSGGYMLVDGVVVGPGATLEIGGPSVPQLLLASAPDSFTSIVVWGGTLTLKGVSAAQPMAITSWDRGANQPEADRGNGRPYIRAVGGRMDLLNVRVRSLGFWSGRTGGVAWTGISSRPSTGSAESSSFTDNTYGAFVARSKGVQFKDDLFEGNELDGLRLHRNATSSTVTFSASARNGGNGFVVSRGATGNVLRDDLAQNNAENGFLLNGLPLVNGASPSGDTAVASIGTVVEDSEAESNGRTGILVEGGAGTVIRRNIVCAAVTGIAVRAGATSTMVVGNEIRCGGRIGLAVGPAVTATTVDGNLISNARIGLLIRNSSGVRIINNRFAAISVFGISVRGASPGVVGNDNVIGGRGFQPIDVRGGADNPTLVSTNTSGWQHRSSLSLLAELRYHPILDTWLAIIALIVVLTIATRFRRRPARPYHYTVPWRPADSHANGNGAGGTVVLAETKVVARKPRRVRRPASVPEHEATA
jgi:hypothetical protein